MAGAAAEHTRRTGDLLRSCDRDGGLVQTVDEYKARLMTLLGGRSIDRIPVSDNRVVLIDDDADPGILPEMRALIRGRCGSAWHYMIGGGGHLPAVQRPYSVVSVLLARLGRD